MENELKAQINGVVEARASLKEATEKRTSAYLDWLDENQPLLDTESSAKASCQEAEAFLRDLALDAYAETGDKAVAPGIGIRVLTLLDYDMQAALDWAMEHKIALQLDIPTFKKIAKTSSLPFVTISEEPQATIATELVKVE